MLPVVSASFMDVKGEQHLLPLLCCTVTHCNEIGLFCFPTQRPSEYRVSLVQPDSQHRDLKAKRIAANQNGARWAYGAGILRHAVNGSWSPSAYAAVGKP